MIDFTPINIIPQAAVIAFGLTGGSLISNRSFQGRSAQVMSTMRMVLLSSMKHWTKAKTKQNYK